MKHRNFTFAEVHCMNIFHAINSSLKSYATKHRWPCHLSLPPLSVSREMEIVTYSKHISEKNITYVSFADFGSD